jgi:hypothetical protein
MVWWCSKEVDEETTTRVSAQSLQNKQSQNPFGALTSFLNYVHLIPAAIGYLLLSERDT